MKKVLLFVVIVLIVGAGIWGFVRNKKSDQQEPAVVAQTQDQKDENGQVLGANNNSDTSGIILFTGDGCPHCKKVEEYITANKVDEKVKFEKKEVWYNKDNAAQLQEKADICKINKDNLGVPLLFDGSKCYVGEVEITDFFNKQMNAQQ